MVKVSFDLWDGNDANRKAYIVIGVAEAGAWNASNTGLLKE